MTDERLQNIFKKIKIEKCTHIRDNIYYIKKRIRQEIVDGRTTRYYTTTADFLLIIDDGVKKAIILNHCDYDLHWHVLKEYRGQHVLSNALRSGIIKEVWPHITSITCCYDPDYENPHYKLEKFLLTEHLASLAGLIVVNKYKCIEDIFKTYNADIIYNSYRSDLKPIKYAEELVHMGVVYSNKRLEHILHAIDLKACTLIRKNMYHVKTLIRHCDFTTDIETPTEYIDKCEVLIITDNDKKKAIILKHGDHDLHWLVLKEYRGQHILSNALRSGIIKEVWPQINTVTFRVTLDSDFFDRNRDEIEAYKALIMVHLAEISGLELENKDDCRIYFTLLKMRYDPYNEYKEIFRKRVKEYAL